MKKVSIRKKEKEIQKQEIRIRVKGSQKDLKFVQYSQAMPKNIDSGNQFLLFGDVFIDLYQLVNQDHFNIISTHNNFLKVLYVKNLKQYKVSEVHLDTHSYGMTDMTMVINLLRTTQHQQLNLLADMIQGYQNDVASMMIDRNKYIEDCLSLDIEVHQVDERIQSKDEENQDNDDDEDNDNIQEEETTNASNGKSLRNSSLINSMDICEDYFNCDEDHGWNFQKSLQKAYKYLDLFSLKMKESNSFFGYIIMKGRKYDQIKSIIGIYETLTRDFMCLNKEQTNYLLLRQPMIYPSITMNEYIQITLRRVFEARIQLRTKGADNDRFRKEPTLTQNVDFTQKSVDNLKVETVCSNYLYVMSNYKHQMDDLMVIYVHTPLGNFKAADILESQRKFRKGITINPYDDKFVQQQETTNQSSYSDLVYDAQSELFKEKFYSIIDNHSFHDINEHL